MRSVHTIVPKLLSKRQGIISPRLLTNRFGRRNKLGVLVDKVSNKFHKRTFRRNFIAGSLALTVFVAIPSIFYLATGATPQLFQSDWSGGVGASIVNQYESVDNLVTSTTGQIGSSQDSIADTWCDTANCNSDFKYRKPILLRNTNTDAVDLTDAWISSSIYYSSFSPNIRSDFGDVRFVTADSIVNGNVVKGVDITNVITSQTLGDYTSYKIKVPSIPVGYSTIYVYYGYSAAASSTVKGLTAKSFIGNVATNNGCVLNSDDNAYCWGFNPSGIFGNGTLDQGGNFQTFVSNSGALSGKTIKQLYRFGSTMCAIASDDYAYCWGYNYSGQIGNGLYDDSSLPIAVDRTGVLADKTIKSLWGSGSTICAVASDDNAYCWGYNDNNGQFGNGTTTSSTIPVAAITKTGDLVGKAFKSITIGYPSYAITSDDNMYTWGAGYMGRDASDYLPGTIHASGALAGKTIKSVSQSGSSTCVIASDDHAYCWGDNTNGQLGTGDTTYRQYPTAIDETGVLSGKTIKSISQSNGSTCVVASDDNVYCWGLGFHGQLGTGSYDSVLVPTAVKTSGALAGKTIKSMTRGYAFTCVIANEDNSAYCWGENNYGQLGNNTSTISNEPVALYTAGVLNGKTIKSISAADGYSSLCAIASDDYIYCWGNNILIPTLSPQAYTDQSFLANNSQVSVYSPGTTEQYTTDAATSGSLISNVFDAGTGAIFDKVTINTNHTYGAGQVEVRIRTDSNADMSTATAWASCNKLSSDDNVYDSTCVRRGQRYLQYQIFLSGRISDELTIDDITFTYSTDTEAPSIPDNSTAVIKTSPTGTVISSGSWTNDTQPYISWADTVVTDNVDGSGVAGYCLYIGEDETANLTTTAGLMSSYPSGTPGPCVYNMTADKTSLDMSLPIHVVAQWGNYDTDVNLSSLNSSTSNIKFKIQAYDNAFNLSSNSIIGVLKLDNHAPSAETAVFWPSKISSSKDVTITWLQNDGAGLGFADIYDDVEGSGVAGLKYCAYDALDGDYSACEDPANYRGPEAADEDGNYGGFYNSNAGQLTLHADDPQISDNSANMITLFAFDNAGNFEAVSQGLVIVSQGVSAAPSDLTVDPAEADSNNFSFSWGTPAQPDDIIASILEGSASNMDYCWTVNVAIASDGHNCNWTAKGATSLPAGPYATQQGVNTLYIMTRNESGNFSTVVLTDDDEDPTTPMVPLLVDDDEDPETPMVTVPNVATVTFQTNTDAPGIPENVEAIDVSTRESDPPMYRVAISWSKPSTGYNKISSYQVMRSTEENGTYILASSGSVSKDTYSYINTDLDNSITYYYYILACDNAGSCGIASRKVSMKPVGYYTTPAVLSDGPTITDVSTKKATINWSTNRETDSKIFISTEPGVDTGADYAAGNSTKLINHSLSLVNLQAGTKYYYRTAWADSGGEALSPEKSFTTLPAPNISEVTVTGITIEGATINFSIENSSKINVYYGKTEEFGGASSINTSFDKSSYSIALQDLEDGAKYYLRLNGFDADGNEYAGNVYSFTTLPRPKISNLRFQPIADAASNTTKVTWTTNVPTSSELSYSTTGEPAKEVIVSKLSTEHEITISGLTDNSEYSLIAKSRDASGNLAVSDTQTFKTALDTRPPKISAVSVETAIKGSGAEARGQIIISWTTDEPGTSQVAYGQGTVGSYGNKTSEDSRLSYEHTVVISDLSTSSIYQVQPISNDKARNEAKGTNQSAIIGRGTEDVFTIIFSSLRNIFGIKG